MSEGIARASDSPRAGARAVDLLERARRAGVLSPLDLHVANRLGALFGDARDAVRWAAALACRQESLGHVCADLERLSEEGLAGEEDGLETAFAALATHATVGEWRAALADSPLVEGAHDAARDGTVKPLVLDAQGRLFLRRLFRAETALADAVARRIARPDLPLAGFDASAAIARLLADRPGSPDVPDDDAPRRALAVGLARPLAVLTGGPGTGKTTLVARLVRLLALQAESAGARPPRVLLLAPTGKAAAAMAGAFARERARPGIEAAIREALPATAETLHRALARRAPRFDAAGARPGRPAGFVADVVVVDEASMVDLEQMERLFAACETVPRLVLLGDPGQLASVEAGAVLSDLCGEDGGGAPAPGLERSVVRLTRSHRYAASGGLGRLAEAVRAGDADAAIAVLDDPRFPDVERRALESPRALVQALAVDVRALVRSVAAEGRPEAKLERLADYRVLCAHRRGAFGVEALARALDEVAALERRGSSRAAAFAGRLLLVTRNAPEQALANGDVGLVERQDGGLRVLFPAADGGVRSLSLARLPAHESAIAMSVHKSQGSEFAAVDLVLAPQVSRLMTRELLYTGITRARERLRIHASEAVLRAAIARRARRDSGLADRLRALAGGEGGEVALGAVRRRGTD